MQGDLFGNISSKNNLDEIHAINGLDYIPDFITTEKEEEELIKHIDRDQSKWLNDLKRRVQHYGYKYDYKKRSIDNNMSLGPLPDWSAKYCKRLVEEGYFSELPDQIIVNEYEPGQGIADHVDCEPCFEDTVISLSLIAPIVMQLKEKKDRTNKLDVFLEPRSIIVMKDEARFNWLHGIAGRKTDKFQGEKYSRQRRVSLTFRKVILNN